MRYIQKGNSPDFFEDWKTNISATIRPPRRSSYEDLNNIHNIHIKGMLRDVLISEQFYLCCYCGINVEVGSCHIEHLKPQNSVYGRGLDLTYTNLLISCESTNHCGHFKKNWYNPDLMISPMDPRCSEYFIYEYTGEIIPIPRKVDPIINDMASETINRLGLNDASLINARKAAIDGVLDNIDVLTAEEIQKLIADMDVPDQEGKLYPFCFTLKYVLVQQILPDDE